MSARKAGALETRGGATLEEIGQLCGLSRERVRQIEASALRKLRAALERRGIRLEDVLPTERA